MLKGFAISQEQPRRQLGARENPGPARIAAGKPAAGTEGILLGDLLRSPSPPASTESWERANALLKRNPGV